MRLARGRAWEWARDALALAALARRRRLSRTTFVSVTGSAGKTTTARLLRAVLERRGPVAPDARGPQQTLKAARTVFGVRRRHWVCVHQTAAWGPGTLDRPLRMLRPDVGVVTTVGDDHLVAFRGREAVAREKAKVVRALPTEGVAVLNADDPLVRAMAAETRARVVLFGRAADADVLANDVRAAFPDRLSFTVAAGGTTAEVATRLVGELWLTSALAAVATGWALGLPLEQAAEALATVDPHPRRVEPVETAGGVTFLRDDFKASAWTVAPALDALGAARAERKVVVLGNVSDDARKPRLLYRELARQARLRADLVVLVGPWSHHGLRARTGDDDGSIVTFEETADAYTYLRGVLRPGDLVLVKSNRHLLEGLIPAVTNGR